jgi:hypothetical protein
MTNRFDQLKSIFPDLLSLDRALNIVSDKKYLTIEQIRLHYITEKIMQEDAKLLRRLATS